ncbi:MAG: glycosyltransferase family 39 protein [Nanoarchaeota archaeon]
MKLKDNLGIVIIITLFLILNFAIINFNNPEWDSAVYVGMGKYLFSHGQAGLWEPIRPLTLPIILGFFWKIGLNSLIAGEIFILLISIGVIILTYILSNKLFDKNTAIAASILVSFSTLMLKTSHQILVEILAVFFLLLGFYFYLEKKNLVSGILFGLAFLTKFPAVLFLIAIFGVDSFYLFFYKDNFSKYFKKFFYIGFGFILIISPYFLFNYFSYNDALFPLKSAQYVIDNVVGCNVLYKQPFYYYIPLIIKDNFLFLFSIIGITFAFFSKNKINKIQISFYAAAFLIYFSNLGCKTERYPILMLPFIAMISGYGIVKIFSRSNKKYIKIALIIVFLISLSLVLNYTLKNAHQKLNNAEFYSYISDKKINGEVLTTNPFITMHTDMKLNLIYYPLYNSSRIDYYISYVNKNKSNISYIFVDTEDIPCHPKDLECPKKTAQFINLLKNNFNISYYKKINDYEQFIFSQ